ncbi:MAG: RsiV family protein [Flavobacteriia bacterium]|jgi:hypothetical protein
MRFPHFLLLIGTILLVNACSGEQKKNTKDLASTNEKETSSDSLAEPQFKSGLVLRFRDYHKEYCFPANEDDPNEFCSEMDVHMLSVDLKDKAVANRINQLILKGVTNNTLKDRSLSQWVSEGVERNDKEMAFQQSIRCDVTEKSKDIFVVVIGKYEYYYGAAHGGGTTETYNIDLHTGKVIGLSDILQAGYGKELKRIAEKYFLEENGAEGWDFTPGRGDFELPQNISFTRKGMVFVYDAYEIGPYAAGSPSMIIPWKELKKLLIEGSFIQDFIDHPSKEEEELGC